MFAALSSFGSWAGKRKRLLAGVVGIAVKSASACVPGVSLAAEFLGQLAEKATEDILDPESKQPLGREQLAQLNDWMASLAQKYAGLLDRLEQLPLADGGTLEQLTQAVEAAIQGRDDLLREFDACLVEVRRQTLSLGMIERKLDEHFHVQQRLSASLEDIKNLFARSPMMSEWTAIRRARPEAVRAVSEADEHFLAGRKEQGVAVLLGLLRQRGVGAATLAHQLGLIELSQGEPDKARHYLRQATQAEVTPVLSSTLATLSTMSGRGVAAWRSLPRGFRVGRKYCIEAEVGRGGMASVYLAEKLATLETERTVAIKVPAPALMSDSTTRLRFEQEIAVSRRLSQDRHPHIVRVLDYEIFDDPFTHQELYALVMEFVEGMSLAHYLARRRGANKPLKISEVLVVMNAVCSALEHAHGQGVYHRDLKPQNVMVAKGLVVKLMDFGIARVLDESRDALTRTGQLLGTLAYLPPELLGGTGVVDARTDIYMMGTLLLEVLTGEPAGDLEVCPDCPQQWTELIGDSMNRIRGKRPATVAEFRSRLQQCGAGLQVSSSSPAAPKATMAGPPAPPRPPAVPVPAPPAVAADTIDRPACFYLGREYDLSAKKVLPDKLIMYDARNLTTHGVIVGMTGSGKTGLAIALLEEAAIDGVPAVMIDPKGDLTNLLLQFPDLSPKRFAEWLNPDDARMKNLSVDAYAQQLSERWRQGLIDSKQAPDRAREMSQNTDFRIYTPGSTAGLPLSILRTFAAPKGDLPLEDLNQKISSTTTALLGLSGITADPMQSREHVLIAQLLQHAWSNRRDLDLPALIKEIQTPSIHTVGAYNLETFFPAKDRLKFASQLNNMLASPMFSTWSQGEPLDLAGMLYRNGRPQHLIFYLAHLDDDQRIFFTTLLLEEMLGWTRRQSGTTSLRALLYFDEVFGYLPPHPGNPPSKQPLLALLREARAFGVGVLLATNNPVDLDYKALSNAGTWFVGKLQMERDKARLLDGLESVAAEYGTPTDRGYLERVIASLGNRIFLMHDINQGHPRLFQTRWALSFLRGPMTREEVSRCVKSMKDGDASSAFVPVKLCNHCGATVTAGAGNRCNACGRNPWESADGPTAVPVASVATMPAHGVAVPYTQPVLPPDVNQFFIPVTPGSGKPGLELEYQPWVLGFAEVVFQLDQRTGREHKLILRLLAKAPRAGHPVEWDKAMPIAIDPAERPEPRARWAAVPESMDTGRKVKALEKVFAEHLYRTQKLALFENRELELVSEVSEALVVFRRRCRQHAELKNKQAADMEKLKFAPKIEVTWQTYGKGREDRVARLEADLKAKLDELAEKYRLIAEEATPVQVKARKVDIRVTHFGLAWAPFWRPAK